MKLALIIIAILFIALNLLFVISCIIVSSKCDREIEKLNNNENFNKKN